MIVARDLSKRFGKVVAVDSMSFRVARGRVVGFLGPNGAGKTTTIRMITGFLTPTAGSIEVHGQDVRRHRRAVQRQIGYLPEATPLFTEMRVADFLKFRARLYGVERKRLKRAVDKAVHRCWLENVRRRPIGQLSKGFRQRVGLAAALVHEPPILILDEPTSGLDPQQIQEVRTLVRELAGKHTIILSTHILSEAELTCDDIILIDRGRVQAQGTVEHLRASAAAEHRYVLETDVIEPEQTLRQLKGVAEIELLRIDDRWKRVTIIPRAGAHDLRESISGALAKQGASVRELRRSRATLEQTFMHIVNAGRIPAASGDREGEPRS